MTTTTPLKSNVEKRATNQFWWIDLMTTDIADAKDFYGEAFGWTFEDINTGPGTYTIARRGGLSVAGMMLIGPEMTKMGVPAHWQSYVLVDDIEATCAKARELGATVMMGPMQATEAGWMAVLQDPQGGSFALWQANQMGGADLVNEPGALRWTELRTRDTDASAAFYGELFGWTYHEEPDAGLPYWTFKQDDVSVAGMMTLDGMPDDVPAHWNVIIGVESADRAVEVSKAHGGTVAFGPAPTPIGTCVVTQDAQGAWITFMQPPAEGWRAR